MDKRLAWHGVVALMVAHCVGMIDLVALPVWVGTLMERYRMDPQKAGSLVTLFLLGAVASSLFFAPRFHRVRPRLAATAGFGVAAVAFLGLSAAKGYAAMAVGHAVAGIVVACALSFTHGTIGRSARPHRLFAIVGMSLGVFAILFLGATPHIVAQAGGPALFVVFGALMAVASVVCAVAFPNAANAKDAKGAPALQRLDAPIVFGVLGVACMALVQAMVFSFLERIGMERGFGSDTVTAVLIALGIVNLFPAPLAAFLEHRWPARKVLLCGPVVQAALALLMTQSQGFAPYAAAAVFFAAVMIFTHTFAFGLLASLEPSGRVLAATPAMLMTGSAIGPLLGGTVVKLVGYQGLGLAAAIVAAAAVLFFARARRPEAVCSVVA